MIIQGEAACHCHLVPVHRAALPFSASICCLVETSSHVCPWLAFKRDYFVFTAAAGLRRWSRRRPSCCPLAAAQSAPTLCQRRGHRRRRHVASPDASPDSSPSASCVVQRRREYAVAELQPGFSILIPSEISGISIISVEQKSQKKNQDFRYFLTKIV